MTIFDIIMFIALGLGAFKGYKKGLIVEILSFLAFFVAIIAGLKFMSWMTGYISEHFEVSEAILPWLSFLVIFIGIILLFSLTGKITKKLIDLTFLGIIDNIAGALVGVLKVAFFISLLLWGLSLVSVKLPPSWVDDSYTYAHLTSLAPFALDVIAFILPFSQDLLDDLMELINPGN